MSAIKVAYQGSPGAYSEEASLKFFKKSALDFKPSRDFGGVFRAVRAGKVQYGVLPIENALTGSIHENFDLLQDGGVWIDGEIELRIRHTLMAPRGVNADDVRAVLSHPQALGQCAGYLRSMKQAKREPYFDTAGAAEHVAEMAAQSAERLPWAAIASERAAKAHNLRILARDIADNAENYTRFLVVRKGKPKRRRPAKHYKTSIVFAFKNIPGALYKALSIFAIRDIDLLKIESRPIHGSPWTYMFYLDFAGHIDDDACHRAIDHLGEITEFLDVLGSYGSAGAVP